MFSSCSQTGVCRKSLLRTIFYIHSEGEWEHFSTHWFNKKLFKVTAAFIPVISTGRVWGELEAGMAVLCFVNFLSLMLPKCLRKCEFCCTAVTGRSGASARSWCPDCIWGQCSVCSASSYTLSRCWICNMHVIIKLCLNLFSIPFELGTWWGYVKLQTQGITPNFILICCTKEKGRGRKALSPGNWQEQVPR